MSDAIVQRVQACSNKTAGAVCGHDLSNHYEEQIPADHQVPNGPRTRRGCCLARGCNCTGFCPPKE